MENQDEVKKRNATVYGKIAKLFGKKEHYVKHILKIGNVNPLYFERLVAGRISPFDAYNRCLNEEKIRNGKATLPDLPGVDTPVFVNNEIQVPVNDEQSPSNGIDSIDKKIEQEGVERTVSSSNAPILPAQQQSNEANNQQLPDKSGDKTIKCVCPKCGESIEVQLANNL